MMNINTFAKVCFLVCLVSFCYAAPQNILLGEYPSLAATIVGPAPFELQMLPLLINDPTQQWNFDAEGYIVNVAEPTLVFDVTNNALVGGTTVSVKTKKEATAVPSRDNQLWNVAANGVITSRLAAGYTLSLDTDSKFNFLEVDYSGGNAFKVTPPVPYVCSSTGDPHIVRFPGNCPPPIEAQKNGTFVLALFGELPQTRVSVTHTQCGRNPGIYCNTKALVRIGNSIVEVEGDQVRINGAIVPVTGTVALGVGFSITRNGPNDFLVVAPNGNVQIKGMPYANAAGEAMTYLNVIVTATSGLVPDGGMCQCKPGEQIANPTTTSKYRRSVDVPVVLTDPQFIASWQYKTYCDDPFFYNSIEEYNVINPPDSPTSNGNWTTENASLRALAELLCAPLLNGKLVTACSPVLSPAPFYRNCLNDVIASEIPEFAAMNIDGYALHCAAIDNDADLPTSGGSTTADGQGLTNAIVGPNTFIIQARDATGKLIIGCGDSFTVSATGPGPITFNVVDNSDGTYTVTYTATVAGEYIFSIKYRNVDHIQNSPRTVIITGVPENPVTSPAHSTASGPGLETIFAGDTYIITVQTKTATGANRVTGGDTVTVAITGRANSQVVDNNDGTYTITYQQDEITTFTITISVNSVQIIGSPFSLESW